MGPTERGLRTILDLMYEYDADPRRGRPVPIDAIYEANTITESQHRAILQESEAERRGWRNAKVASEMSADSDMLFDRAVRANVPQRYANAPVDHTQSGAFAQGRWAYVHGPDVESVTRKACGLLKGWMSDNPFGTSAFVRSTTVTSALAGESAQDEMVRLSAVGMLLLSGLGAENATAWAVSRLHELLDTRFGNELPVIVTTRHSPDELATHLGDRGGDGNARGIVELLRRQSVLIGA